jgi:hypothetical protein
MANSSAASLAIPAGPTWTPLFKASAARGPIDTTGWTDDGEQAAVLEIRCISGTVEVQMSHIHRPDEQGAVLQAGESLTFSGKLTSKIGTIGWARARGVSGAGSVWFSVTGK